MSVQSVETQEVYLADSVDLLVEAMVRLEGISSRSVMFTSTELETKIRSNLTKLQYPNLPPKLEY